jgi:hypothetical protein
MKYLLSGRFVKYTVQKNLQLDKFIYYHESTKCISIYISLKDFQLVFYFMK